MKYRILGKTGFNVSEIGYGSWAIGSGWGNVSDEQARATLGSITHTGINFIDTADIYGNGRSERLIGEYLKQRKSGAVYVATKIGRGITPHAIEGYTKKNITMFVDRSCKNLGVECLDLVQLHTPPNQIYYMPEVFGFLDDLVSRKKVRHYGVSVEKVEEGLKAIEYPNISTIQIVFNMFRQRPMELLFQEAAKRGVGIIVRVPLASGLLTGKFHIFSRFPKDDHRNFNRNGQVFDRGETFAGVDFLRGLAAVKQLEKIKPRGYTMTQFALRWILMHKEVSTVIVGGKTPEQIVENSVSGDLPKLSADIMKSVMQIYSSRVKEQVHYRW